MPGDPFSIKVTSSTALLRWEETIHLGLESSGAAWQSELKRYPPQTISTVLPTGDSKYPTVDPIDRYKRTGQIGHKANFSVDGMTMHVGSVPAAAYALYGTGIYGPKHEPIRPVHAKMLAWQTPSGAWIHAKSVRGFIWAGKLEKAKAELVRGFAVGLRKALRR